MFQSENLEPYIHLLFFLCIALIGIKNLIRHRPQGIDDLQPGPNWLTTIGLMESCRPNTQSKNYLFLSIYEYYVHGSVYKVAYESNKRPPFQSQIIMYDPQNPGLATVKRSPVDGFPEEFITSSLDSLFAAVGVGFSIYYACTVLAMHEIYLSFPVKLIVLAVFAILFLSASVNLIKDGIAGIKKSKRRKYFVKIQGNLIHIEKNAETGIQKGIYEYFVSNTKYLAAKEFLDQEPLDCANIRYNTGAPSEDFLDKAPRMTHYLVRVCGGCLLVVAPVVLTRLALNGALEDPENTVYLYNFFSQLLL